MGFTVHELPGKIRDTPWPTLLQTPALAIVGLGMVLIWMYTIRAGLKWVEYWRGLLKRIEPLGVRGIQNQLKERLHDCEGFRTMGGAGPLGPPSSKVPKFNEV